MSDVLKKIPTLTFWAACVVSAANIVAAVAGFGAALKWLSSVSINPLISVTAAVVIMGFLVVSWINSLMGNHAGKLIYLINILVSPFGYHAFGLPYWLGLSLAFAPYFLYFGAAYLVEQTEMLIKKWKK
ncbi:hypothetical protein [Acinetobacter tianfuensis]|uniref:Uncharacterized protein n=1 Tax=Acinetobacter tianfuensis TaxID=2419603 RepID=A0A3A8EDK9_9GAMM|nr:hypothetical protein [Acinetobacter tianfuensis]RKG32299.1 hypothetical protein D7V32_06420 [Acinetobacter tianfuensis]